MIRRRFRRLLPMLAAVVALVLAPMAATASAPVATAGITVAAAASAPTCTAGDLGVWVAADQSVGTAGTIYTPLEFTNLSSQTCEMSGFPGVTAISSSGAQLGSPASWDPSVPATTVVLAPGTSAYALLGYSDVVTGNCPAANRVTAYELQVYPPNAFGADHAFWDLATCTAAGSTNFLRVRVVAAGLGVRGSTG